jgi:hypothetical protein
MNQRPLIMLSHANPADNDAARWFAGKLAALGYSVWVDIEKLKGGETFWPTIEEIISRQAGRVVLLLSRASNEAYGVAQEMGAAKIIEGQLGINDFVIPLLLDDLPYDQMRFGLDQRQCLGSGNWAKGLNALIEKLSDSGIQPRSTPDAQLLSALATSDDLGVEVRSVPYDLNRVLVRQLPERIFASEACGGLEFAAFSSQSVFDGRHLSFRSWIGRAQLFEREKPWSIDTSEFLCNGWGRLKVSPIEARNLITELLNAEFRQYLMGRGLVRYDLGRFNPIFFFNSRNRPNQNISVRLPELSKRSNRAVWGIFKSRFWHLGIEARFLLREENMLVLLPHILVTSDGVDGRLSDDDRYHVRRMVRARRRVAKSWWNDKWRGFYYAFLAWMAEGRDDILIPLGNAGDLVLETKPQRVSCSVSHTAIGELNRDVFELDD